MGGFAIIRAVDGAVAVDDLASNKELRTNYRPLDLGPEFARAYGHSRPTSDFRNSNVSSHFPYAAQIWQSIWQQESGERVDGAIATDPVALSYVLEVLGPVTLADGEKITADNVVELTEATAYSRFGDNQTARKQYLQEVAAAVVQKMTGSISHPARLLDALGRAASEGRIAVWSSNPTEQSVLADTQIGHTVPDDPAPYAGVVINNLGGNKLDYYLRREIQYEAETCAGDSRRSKVSIRLTNDLPSGNYTDYVASMYDNPTGEPFGTNLIDLSLLSTQGAKMEKITVDGRPHFGFVAKELGHPLHSVQFAVPQGDTVEVVFEMTEPTVPGAARVPIQPLIDAPKVDVNVPEC